MSSLAFPLAALFLVLAGGVVFSATRGELFFCSTGLFLLLDRALKKKKKKRLFVKAFHGSFILTWFFFLVRFFFSTCDWVS